MDDPRQLSAEARIAATTRAQAEASDPAASVWVSANAGAGKTHVLKQRVLRILLAGTAPDRILCLTYTKAAAAEMQQRVFSDLSRWATTGEETLVRLLTDVLARAPSREEATAARKLFARAIETPGGLKVQTIHAFCERLLQRFPLEAGVPPGFSILDDTEGARLRREATDAVLAVAARRRDGRLGRALDSVIAFAAGDGFDKVLAGALARRHWLETVARLIPEDGEDELSAADALYRRALGVRAAVSRETIEAEMAGVVADADLRSAAEALRDGKKTDGDLADALAAAASAASIPARVACLERAFLTSAHVPRADSRFVTKAVRDRRPDVHTGLVKARDRFAKLHVERLGLTVAEASVALMAIAGAVMQRYREGKALRAALDFDDLVERTAGLLASSSAAEWVLYKLDGGLDHILVDEAQDTAPLQWRVIESLAAEFFAGTGAHEQPRSVFAVGDEKQSIYSFQGAEPRMFAETGLRFREAAEAARLPWRTVPLTLSFRTVEPLLDAVDKVFESRERTPGLTSGDTPVRHYARRLGAAGLIEMWDPEVPAETEEVDAWLPFAEAPQASPESRLAERIADTIADWIRDGEMLPSQGRPIRAGDILILLRRRHPFAGPMVAALKARRIPVAGADRLRLTQQIAVQDLIALGDFLTLPEDDLALATILKSPLFDLDDGDLIRLAPGRKGTLWSALIAAARTEARYQPAARTLRRWRGIADQSPPFEFYAEVLDRDGGRRKLIERLGPEAVDAITELLNLALAFDEAEPPSMTGFLAWLRAGSPEIKRDMEHGRDEVRVLTVHGAKGLEAPIVFLPDTCSARSGRQAGELVELGSARLAGGEAPWVWPVRGARRLAAVEAGQDAAGEAERDERNRLLYVALTRARDRLYIAGFHGAKGPQGGCWYELIETGLRDVLQCASDAQGRRVRRYRSEQSSPPEKPAALLAAGASAEPPPEWASRPAPKEARLAIPLAPSRLAPYDTDEMGEPAPLPGDGRAKPPAPREPAAPSPLRLAGDNRFLRGTITHALLEHLPTLDPARWPEAARAFVATRGAALPAKVRASIADETLAVLRDPGFRAVFGPLSRAEVPIVAEIPPPKGRGQPLRLNGQIDRLAAVGDEVLIVDYKTNRPPPAAPTGVAAAYLFQLAAYRLAVGRIHPGRTVRAAILWTDGPRLMEIPPDLLDKHQQELWQLDPGRIDA